MKGRIESDSELLSEARISIEDAESVFLNE